MHLLYAGFTVNFCLISGMKGHCLQFYKFLILILAIKLRGLFEFYIFSCVCVFSSKIKGTGN